MPKLSRYRLSDAVLMLLLIGAAYPLTAADVLQAQQNMVPEEVIQKWKEFERFAQTIQGRKSVTVTSSAWNNNPRSYSDTYKQNHECALYSSSLTNVSGVMPKKWWTLVNLLYSAEIEINTTEPDKVLLKNYEPNSTMNSPGKRSSVFEQIFFEVGPHFSYQQVRLSQLIKKDAFKVKKVTKTSLDGHDLVQLDFSFEDKKQQLQSNGSLYLDPGQCWCIRLISESYARALNGKPFFKGERKTEYQTIAHASGFPLVKSQTAQEQGYSGKKKFEGTQKTDYEWEINDHVPNSEFTLTAFGLPEPAEVAWEKPTPWYLWLMAAAAGCFAIALLFRYLLRRQKRRPA